MGAQTSQIARRHGTVVVTVDALGTLYGFREPITVQYVKIAKSCGLNARIDDGELKKAFKNSFKEITARYPNYGKGQLDGPRAWWNLVVNDSFRQVVSPQEIPASVGDRLYDHFSSEGAYKLYDDARSFLVRMQRLQERLRAKECHLLLGVVTNSDPRVGEVLQALGLQVRRHGTAGGVKDARLVGEINNSSLGNDLASPQEVHSIHDKLKAIDFLTTSYDASAEKPDLRIFMFARAQAEEALASITQQGTLVNSSSSSDTIHSRTSHREGNALNFFPVVHIGDDYEKDYLGAKASGFQAIYLLREGQEAASDVDEAVVNDLELAAIMIESYVGVDRPSNES